MWLSIVCKCSSGRCYYNFSCRLCNCQRSNRYTRYIVVSLFCSLIPYKCISIVTASYRCLTSGYCKTYLFIIYKTFDTAIRCQWCSIIRLIIAVSCDSHVYWCDLVSSCHASAVVSDTCDRYFNCSCYICVISLVVTYRVVSSFYKNFIPIFYGWCPLMFFSIISLI